MDFFPSQLWNWKNIWLKKHKNNGIDKIYITDNRIEWTRVEKMIEYKMRPIICCRSCQMERSGALRMARLLCKTLPKTRRKPMRS